MGRYLIKTKSSEHFANIPPLEKEMLEGRREKGRKKKNRK